GGGTGGGSDLGPPAAQITLDRLQHGSSDSITFFGQGVDPDGGALRYRWDLDGDGRFDASGQTVHHRFHQAGAYPVLLEVEDPAGRTATAQAVVTIDDNPPPQHRPPAVSVGAFTLVAAAGAEMGFVLHGADPGGAPLATIAWDFDGDGIEERAARDRRQPRHTYTTPGHYRAVVTVTDRDGDASEASVTVFVCDPTALPSLGPTAAIVPLEGDLRTSPTETLTLACVGSDPDGGPLAITWQWDQDGDGALDASATDSPLVLSSLPEGVHRVVALVTDDEGAGPSSAEAWVISEAPGNATSPGHPAACAWADTLVAAVGEPVGLHVRAPDAESSSATHRYAWDADGDRAVDGTAQDLVFRFATPGVYSPEVMVTDVDGNRAVAHLTLLVLSCTSLPQPSFWFDRAQTTLYGGGSTEIALTPVAGGSASPETYRLSSKFGEPAGCGDLCASELEVLDRFGQPLADPCAAPLGPPILVPGLVGGSAPIRLHSLANHASAPCVARYGVASRIEARGRWVQVVRTEVRVLHDMVWAELAWPPPHAGGNFSVIASFGIAAVPAGAAIPVARPPVHELKIVFAEQSPPWVDVPDLRAQPAGWRMQRISGGLRLWLADPASGQPLTAGRAVQLFRFTVATSTGSKPTGGQVRLYDAAGNEIGIEPFDKVAEQNPLTP
ncbi:MAG: PKD domain-containing protein, partial [Planctomycetota bacterium]